MWQTLFRSRSSTPSNEISRYDLSWYLQQIMANPWGTYGGLSYTQTRDGKPVEEIPGSFTTYVNQAYKANGVVYAVILARRLVFSEARFQFRRLINGRPGDLFGTSALSIVEKPWPNATTGEMLGRADQDVSLGGNFYVANEGDRLRRLRPDWMQIVLTAPPQEAVDSDVAGYMYTPGGIGTGAEPQLYLPDEVAHWSPEPDPDAMYRGMSWLTPILREIEADQAATAHKNAFFRNGAKPGLVVSLKESVREEQFKRFVRAMNETHQGSDSAYKTLYLAGGADVTVAGADLRQLDFRATQGAGETRICAAGGVPPVIVGLSEGLQAATYSNYASARRKFGDGWARPMWRSICAALETVVEVPGGAQLWYDDRDIAFLREDQRDAAEIQQTKASTIAALITAGFTPESSVASVDADDRSLLVHTGLVSVQLQPPGQGVPTDTAAGENPGETPAPDTTPSGSGDESTQALVDALDEVGSGASRASTPGDDLLVRALAEALDEIYRTRHVRTAAGAKKYGLPIGSPIGGGHAKPHVPGTSAKSGRTTLKDRLVTAINDHLSGKNDGDPLSGFDREQLRKVAKDRGIPLRRGEERDSIAKKLIDSLTGGEAPQESKPEAPKPAKKVTKAVEKAAPPTPTRASSRTAGKDISGDVDYASLPTSYNAKTGENDALKAIIGQQGYDGKPRVVSADEFDAALGRGDVRETWRGMTGTDAGKYAEQYRTGDFYVGLGINGDGTYVATNKADGEYYGSTLLRIGLSKDAKVVSADDLDREMDAFFAQLDNRRKSAELKRLDEKLLKDLANAKTARERANIRRKYRDNVFGLDSDRSIALQRDPGVFAALRGYDAIEIPKERSPDKHHELIVLNRTATIVQEA